MSKITVTLVDDDSLMTGLLKEFLQRQKNIEVLSVFDSGESFIEKLKENPVLPEVVVLDLKMKEKNGVEVATFLRTNYPQLKIIVMSSLYKRSFMGFMLKTGVSAFIPKGLDPKKLVEIIEEVSKNDFHFLPDQLDVLREQVSSKSPRPKINEQDKLTDREIEVLQHTCHQKTAREIGELMFITVRTVEGHKSNLLMKTGSKNLAGLVIYAIQNEHVNADEVILL